MKNGVAASPENSAATEFVIHKPLAGTNVMAQLPHDGPSAFNFGVEDIRAMKILSDGGLLISFNDGSTLTVTNFAEARASFPFNDIKMTDGTVVNLQKLAQGLEGTQPNDTVADLTILKPVGAMGATDLTFNLQEGKTYILGFDLKEVSTIEQDNGNLVVTFKDGSHLTLQNYDAVVAGVLPPQMTLADGSVIPAAQLINVLNVAAAEQVKVIEPAAGDEAKEALIVKKVEVAEKQATAEQLAQLEPAAGGAAGPIGGTSGYGFNSSVDPAGINGLNAIGPIGPTELQFGLPELLEGAIAPQAPTPLVPLLTATDKFTFEDTPVNLQISATGAATDQLTLTVSNIPAGWDVDTVNSGGTFNSATGTWTIVLPTGQSYSSGPILIPPHDSDADIKLPTHGPLHVTLTSTDTTTGAVTTTDTDMNVTVDAVADQPDLAVQNVSGSDNVPLPLDIQAAVVDVDGSEVLTTATLTGIPAGFTLNGAPGANISFSGGVWTVGDASFIDTLTLTAPRGFDGSFVVTVRVNNEEQNLTDDEITLTNNTNFNTESFLVTFNDTVPVVGDSVATVDDTSLVGGPNVAMGNVAINFQLDTPGTFAPTNTFTAGGALAGGTLKSNGNAVNVTLAGNTYTGTANGVTVFTLQVNSDGTYTFTQFEQLDHSDVNNHNETITLNFTVQGTDFDGDTDTGVITINVNDDGPTANDDAIATGNSVSGNVTTNDTLSQDTPNTVTQVELNGVVTLVPQNGSNVNIVGQFGTLTINNTGAFTYTSNNTGTGTDNYIYTLRDFDGDTDTATLAARVNDIDTIPVVNDSAVTVDETNLAGGPNVIGGTITADFFVDGPGTITPTSTFTSSGSKLNGNLTSNGNAVNVTLAGNTYTGTANGVTVFTLVVNTNGTYTFTQFEQLDHADGNNPNDSIALNFTVVGTDNDGDTDTGVITVNVIDDAPIAVNDSFISAGQTASGNVMANDIVGQDTPGRVFDVTFGGQTVVLDPNGANSTITNAAGTLVINTFGQFTYTPPLPGNGTTFQYRLVDFDNDKSVVDAQHGQVVVDTDGQPIVGDSLITTDETTLVNGPAVTNGSVSVEFFGDAPGTVTTTGSFTSTGSKLNGNLTSHGSPVTVTVAGNTYTGKDALNNTVFTLTVNGNGSYTFTQFEQLDHANGNDPNDIITLNFGVVGTDADGDTDLGTITVNVRDDAPSALDDTFNLAPNVNSVSGNVLSNDTLGQDTPVPVVSVVYNGNTFNVPQNGTNVTIVAAHGTLVINNAGAFTYTSNNTTTGTDTFTYTIRDFDNDPSSANLNLTVTDIDTVPVIDNSSVSVDETNLAGGPNVVSGTVGSNFFADGPGSIAALNQFTAGGSLAGGSLKSNGNAVTVTLAGNTYTGTANGVTIFTLALQANGNYTFTQFEQLDHADATNPNDVITLNFTVQGTDSDGDTDTGVITVNVLDDAPVAVNDSFLSSTSTASGNIMANDNPGQDVPARVYDVTFGGQTVVLNPNGSNSTITNTAGTLVINTNGQFTYTPPQPGNGTTFQYRLIDFDNDTSVVDAQHGQVVVDTDGTPVVTNTSNTVQESGNKTVTGTVTADFFGDGPGSFLVCSGQNFTSGGSQKNGVLSSSGVPVTVTSTASGYTGTANGQTVFTLSIGANGSYSFTLFKPLDHADVNNPADIINLNFMVCAVDADGDVGHGTLTINVVDSAPVANNDITIYCDLDTFHNGNLITAFHDSNGGVDSTSFDTPTWLYAVQGAGGSATIAPNGAAAVEGQFGTLYVFANGSYIYSQKVDGLHTDTFTYFLQDGDGDTESATVSLQSVANHINETFIEINGNTNGTGGSDVLVAYNGGVADTVFAGGGDDAIFSWTGNDNLHGGAGNDLLAGEGGADNLWGDSGADFFVTDRGDMNTGVFDTIKDFNASEGDVIDLTQLVDNGSAAQASINSYVQAVSMSGGTMLQVNNQDGGGWHNAVFIENQPALNVQTLLNNGNLDVT